MAAELTFTDEWKECRSSIGRFDGHIVDLEKVSFGLIPTVIGLSAFLTQSTQVTLSNQNKAVVACVIMLLITALFTAHRHLWVFRAGAVERALDLEQGDDRCGPEQLTGSISRAAIRSWTGYIVLGLFLSLLASAFGLGEASVRDQPLDAPRLLGSSSAVLTALGFCLVLVFAYRFIRRVAKGQLENTRKWKGLAILSPLAIGIGICLGVREILFEQTQSIDIFSTGIFIVFATAVATIVWYFVFTDARCGPDRFRPSVACAPTLTALSVASPFATVVGRGFGGQQRGVTFNGVALDQGSVRAWSDTAVTFRVPHDNPAAQVVWQPGAVAYVGVDIVSDGTWRHSSTGLLLELDQAMIDRL